ncbi:tol-pal system YbgF family protein [Pseudomonas sp. TH10]|uniref:tetratricopeptide repeat protein n=1 Tax=Pseudomonas sp. TH10 TaxID=2796376 RepID=UPI001912CEFD|nr:tetratricopeptide repeat protein [Pseudomonas sp. TH10]MBK5516769.1 tetratricopeptide repeat protein [Pseudomonas sp. TH10]
MRFVPIAALALSVLAVTGCTRWSMNHHLNNAYSAYDRGNCEQVMLELSKVERASRARPYVWPEVSMMRGQCLERQKMFVDAAQTYQFIMASYPNSEYAYRARARLETLQSLGHYPLRSTSTSTSAVRATRF